MAGASEQLQEEERDNVYDKAGFLSFTEYGTEALINLRQVEC